LTRLHFALPPSFCPYACFAAGRRVPISLLPYGRVFQSQGCTLHPPAGWGSPGVLARRSDRGPGPEGGRAIRPGCAAPRRAPMSASSKLCNSFAPADTEIERRAAALRQCPPKAPLLRARCPKALQRLSAPSLFRLGC
jgi:hypothetical protein